MSKDIEKLKRQIREQEKMQEEEMKRIEKDKALARKREQDEQARTGILWAMKQNQQWERAVQRAIEYGRRTGDKCVVIGMKSGQSRWEYVLAFKDSELYRRTRPGNAARYR